MNLSSTQVRLRNAGDMAGLRLHTPMPPEVDPDAPPPPATDPERMPGDPADNPPREPEGDPPREPPPVRACSSELLWFATSGAQRVTTSK